LLAISSRLVIIITNVAVVVDKDVVKVVKDKGIASKAAPILLL
jgi:hypothetical protein